MRYDMGKVVIERPRRGSRSADSPKVRMYGKIIRCDGETTADTYDYEGVTRLPMSFCNDSGPKYLGGKVGTKMFSDVLGPIEGYLKKSCGRLWDDVYSEICENLGQASWPIRHIITQHLRVNTNTYRGVDGNVWTNEKFGPEIVSGYNGVPVFYVEPETGILRMTDNFIRTIRRYRPYRLNGSYKPDPIPNPTVSIDSSSHYERIKGIWYIISYREIEYASRYYPEPETGPEVQDGQEDGLFQEAIK